jgi:hypothetical protein
VEAVERCRQVQDDAREAGRVLGQDLQQRAGSERDPQGLGRPVQVRLGEQVVRELLVARLSRPRPAVPARLVEDLRARRAGQQRTGLRDRRAEAVGDERDRLPEAAYDGQMARPLTAGRTSTR